MSEDWKESLPEGLREAPFIGKAESAEDALGKLKHAGAYMGNSIRLPDKAATDEQVKEYQDKVLTHFPNLMTKPGEDNYDEVMAQLGRPENEDGYGALEGMDEASLKQAREMALQAGLTKTQFEKLYGTQAALQQATSKQMEAARTERLERLQREWGDTFNDRIAEVKTLLKDTGAPEPLLKSIQEDQYDPESVAWLHQWAKMTSETADKSRDTRPANKLTPEEAEVKAKELLNDEAYWDPMHPRHQMLKDRVLELNTIAYG